MQKNTLKRVSRVFNVTPLLRPPVLSDDQNASLKREQLRAITELTNIIILGCLLNAAVLVFMSSATSLSNMMIWWGGIMAAVLAYVLGVHIRAPRENRFEDRPDAHLARFVRGTTCVGVLWALVPMVAIPVSGADGFTGVGIVMIAMMFGGVLFLGRVPEAAMGLVLPIVAGILIGLQFLQDPSTNLLSIIVLTYAGVLYFSSRLAFTQFVNQFLDKGALEDQMEVIGLLLRDFEENASDWLWETDTKGILRPLASEFGLSMHVNDILSPGQDITEAFDPSESRDSMIKCLQKAQPFRDIVLSIETENGSKWISFTGKPLYEKSVLVGFRGVASDVTKSKETQDQIDFLAHFDTLTQLPNRESLSVKLRELLSETKAWKNEYALVWLDLDNFKWINDTLGHQTGDDVLKSAAARLTDFVGDASLVARISGDEFALICRNDGYKDLCARMDELVKALAEPYSIWGTSVMCRASLGVKVMMQSQSDINSLLKHAELALYSAKDNERGSWALFDQKLENFARAQHELQADLENAIERGELRLFFQPTVDATTHDVVGCEALIRWQHPRKGLLSPAAFIEFAEETDMITRIGDWVIRQALCEAQRLPDHVRIAVNISPLQLRSANLVQTIVNALATNGIAANRLELEITESVMITDTEFTMQRLRQLKELGLRIALDDFGTGFSSLSYLREFPFDKLKIDKSFTENLETDKDTQAITRATLQLAKALGISVTGEGVETGRQGDFLRDNGCDELQGYLHSRPMPLEKLEHLMELKPAPPPIAVGKTTNLRTVPKPANDVNIRQKA
jgi:diguanylate cyclase (GGDEF)-like protein